MSAFKMILTGCGGLLLLAVAGMFNSMVRRKNQVEYALASIDAQLRKRFDLIPNLIAVVEKYMSYEQTALEGLTALRARAASGGLNEKERFELDSQMAGTMKSLFAVAESYPHLRASSSFLHLQGSLNEVEEQLAAARRAYNAAVTDYNNGCEMLPLSLVASTMGYRLRPWFEISAEERQPVKVWR